jgi:hypothetical protein
MDERLIYHTSLERRGHRGTIGSLKPKVALLKYHTSLQSTDIAISNLKKFNNKLDENNIVALAFLANNPAISEEEREKYNRQLKEKAMIEYNNISTYINDHVYRNENSSINITECDDKIQ